MPRELVAGRAALSPAARPRYLRAGAVCGRIGVVKTVIQSWLHTARIIARNLRARKYEPEIHFLDRFLAPDDVCLHIGASDGRHTVVMSRLIGGGHIHCFEPSVYTLAIFRRVMRFHRIQNVSIYNLAVGDRSRRTNLITPVKSNGHLGRSFAFLADAPPELDELARTRGFRGLKVDPINVCTVDDFCREHRVGAVKLIRCDVEGAELLVLHGAREILERDRPVLLLEVHPHALRDQFSSSAQAVKAELERYGYRFFMVRDRQLHEVSAFIDEPWRDYFCVSQPAAAGLAI